MHENVLLPPACISYRAELFDTADARGYIDPSFRAKYGYADQVHEI